MSGVSPLSPTAPFVRPVGWSDGRIRRARLFAVAVLAAVVLGLLSLSLPWYGFSVAGTPRCTLGNHPASVTLVTTGNVHIPGVVGAGCISGYQTVHQDALLAAANTGNTQAAFGPSTAGATPSSQFGLPSTAFLLILGGALVVAAMIMRNGFPGLLGLLTLAVSWNALGSLEQTMTFGVGGQLNHPQSGLGTYQFLLTFTVFAAAVGCGWVAWINHTARAEAKRIARAEGREDELPPSFVDQLAATALKAVAQKAEKVEKVEKAREAAKSGAR
jgi:hypothetical protein